MLSRSLRYLLQVITLSVIAIFMLSCGGSHSDPITAPAEPYNPPTSGLTGVTETSSTGADTDNPGTRILWGYFDVFADADTMVFDIVPLRTSEYTFNVTKFFQPPAGNPANLTISIHDASQFPSTGRIDINLNITHPFPGAVQLRGFDVMAVFMGNGSIPGFADSDVLYAATGGLEPVLLNADGYTRWMNPTEFTGSGVFGFTPGSKGIPGFVPTATINGYKLYSEFLGVDEDIQSFLQSSSNCHARACFKPTSTLTRRMEIQFPMSGGKPLIRFQYAIVASWAAPDPASLPNPTVDDFPPGANAQEPVHIAITDNGSSLWWENATSFGGTLKLQIEVFDWQAPSNPAGVPGELSALLIETPSGLVIPSGSVDVLSTATVSPGSDCSSVYTVEISGMTPHSTGRQEFLVTAESAWPLSYDQGFGKPYPVGAHLAAYNRFTLIVGNTNPCPTPNISSLSQTIANINDIVSGLGITGTNLVDGPQAAAELRRSSGNISGTNINVGSTSSASADFDLTGATAGMYDFFWRNGCGEFSPLLTGAFEVNTPPTSTGITGPTSGDATLTSPVYNANAIDLDFDPMDTLTYSWEVWDSGGITQVVPPTAGDPFTFSFATLSIGMYDIFCDVSDGYAPADLQLTYPVQRLNTQPTIGTISGNTPVWIQSTEIYKVSAGDLDSWQTLTYKWSIEIQGAPPVFSYAGGPTPGDITFNFASMGSITGDNYYEIICRVDDGSGAPNATATSSPFVVYIANMPYTSKIPITMFNQIITAGLPAIQGVAGCPSFWDSFYGQIGGFPFTHPDVTVLSGPSLGTPGVMVIADELGVFSGPFPPPPPTVMGFAHFTCPYSSGNAPSWTWTTMGLSPFGPDMVPSVVSFDGNSQGELFLSNSQMTNKLAAILVPDPSAFQHYFVGGVWLNDLFTSLPGMQVPDVAVDSTAGFDMGSPGSPMSAPIYGLYTQDISAIIWSCGGPQPGAVAAAPVHILQFPSLGVQPAGLPVDLPGSVGVVAPMPIAMVGPGPGMFNIAPGGPSPSGVMIYPEPYYALAIDDDSSDNNFPSMLPQPVGQWVIAATIDGDRDLEVYEIDFGVPQPGPAPLLPFAIRPMGSFMGGNPNAIPLDCEFISNFSGFGSTLKPLWQDDLLAVLLTDPMGMTWQVEIFQIAPGILISMGITMPVPTPPGIMFPVGGIAYNLDVDEVTGDIYVLHQDSMGTASLTVTMIPY